MPEDKKFNGTFTKIKSWQKSQKGELVLSLVTDNETNDKRFCVNTQWVTKTGEKGRSKAQTIPLTIAKDFATTLLTEAAKIGGSG